MEQLSRCDERRVFALLADLYAGRTHESDSVAREEEAIMAITDIQDYLKLIPAVTRAPEHAVWMSYDPEADILYVNFKKPSDATDSEMTDEDIIVRYAGEEVIGFTVLHASARLKKTGNREKPRTGTCRSARLYA